MPRIASIKGQNPGWDTVVGPGGEIAASPLPRVQVGQA